MKRAENDPDAHSAPHQRAPDQGGAEALDQGGVQAAERRPGVASPSQWSRHRTPAQEGCDAAQVHLRQCADAPLLETGHRGTLRASWEQRAATAHSRRPLAPRDLSPRARRASARERVCALWRRSDATRDHCSRRAAAHPPRGRVRLRVRRWESGSLCCWSATPPRCRHRSADWQGRKRTGARDDARIRRCALAPLPIEAQHGLCHRRGLKVCCTNRGVIHPLGVIRPHGIHTSRLIRGRCDRCRGHGRFDIRSGGRRPDRTAVGEPRECGCAHALVLSAGVPSDQRQAAADGPERALRWPHEAAPTCWEQP